MRISLKNYAATKNISYEAVRKQVKRYEKELEGHIFKENRTQFLDEFACDFLDEKRNKNPIIIQEQNKDAELEQLRADVEFFKAKLFEKQEKLEAAQDKIIELQEKCGQLELENKEMKLLSEAPKEQEKEQRKGFFSKIAGIFG